MNESPLPRHSDWSESNEDDDLGDLTEFPVITAGNAPIEQELSDVYAENEILCARFADIANNQNTEEWSEYLRTESEGDGGAA